MSLRTTFSSIAAHLPGIRPHLPGRIVLAGNVDGGGVVSTQAGNRPTWQRLLGSVTGRSESGDAGSRPEVPRHPVVPKRGSDRNLAKFLLVRRDFIDALTDVPTPGAYQLLERIRASGSASQLWHLRPEVFDAVSRFHAQAEADRRLAQLNRHFPTRAPRSGFGSL